jgi:hypothetical protein
MHRTETIAQHGCKTRRLKRASGGRSMKALSITWMLAILPSFAAMWGVTV